MNQDPLESVRHSAVSLARVIALLRGDGVVVRSEERSGGGSINDTRILNLSDGTRLFMKCNSTSHAGLFEEEARGLMALARAEGPRVPRVEALFTEGSRQFLLMEYIEKGRTGGDFFSRFGRAMARLHRTNRNDRCGFERDNHIGSTPQRNTWNADWHVFFGEQRLLYQAELARRQGLADDDLERRTRTLAAKLPDLLPGPDGDRASLLHGDLWGGNYMVDGEGEPVLIDPATYYGHREADLAMTELFGGFSPAFYRAYDQEWTLEPGYADRRDIYNLYHLLNHLNLFGGGYLGSCRAILRRFS
ncbi:MAG: fructosamine kinase family protein [Spirochaetaceae bacterium]|nr:MAG: fructosamine kinase family protein [Spirochaetaceae bacterium]